MRFFPAVRCELQHPRPAAYPSVPFVAKKILRSHRPRPLVVRVYVSIQPRKKIVHAEREIPVLVHGYYDFQNPP
jgi:hypothetical protein